MFLIFLGIFGLAPNAPAPVPAPNKHLPLPTLRRRQAISGMALAASGLITDGA